MTLFFDRLIDTKEKRACLCMVSFLIVCLCFIIPYLILSCSLLQIQNYQQLFSLTQNPLLTTSYLSRVLQEAISLTSFSFLQILTILKDAISLMELVMGLSFIAVASLVIHKKKTTICFMILLIEGIVCGILVILALQSSSLQSAIMFLRWIGWVILLCNAALCVIVLHQFIKELNHYRHALLVEAIEVSEDEQV